MTIHFSLSPPVESDTDKLEISRKSRAPAICTIIMPFVLCSGCFVLKIGDTRKKKNLVILRILLTPVTQ